MRSDQTVGCCELIAGLFWNVIKPRHTGKIIRKEWKVSSVIPQPVVAKLTRAAIFLVVTVKPGNQHEDTIRALCGDLSSLLRAVGFRDLEGRLSCIMGFGSDAWDRLFGKPRPIGLHPFREIKGQHHAVSTPGDILFHIRAMHMDLCFELATHIMSRIGDAVTTVDEVHGFKYFDERDLLGFVDGTENPVDEAAIDAAIIGDEDPDFAGSSYVITQKYLHDLKGWNAVPVEQQENIIGRAKLSDIEQADAAKATYAHNVLTNIEENGEQLQIVRDNMPFGDVGDPPTGSRRCSSTCLSVYRLAITTACWISARPSPVRCFSCPPRPSWTMFRQKAQLRSSVVRPRMTKARRMFPNRNGRHQMVRSVLVRSKESRQMNNLHRELAPISEKAWAQIEQEASRTLKRHLAARRVVDVVGPKGSEFSAVGTGHLQKIQPPLDDIQAAQHEVKPLVQLRVPFELSRQDIDSVERGANDPNLQPLKDAARKLAFAEDGAVFEGYESAGIQGIRQATSNTAMTFPADVESYPAVVAQAVSELRDAGVNGPYMLLLGEQAYTAVSGATDDGYPVLKDIRNLVDGEIIWAPAIKGGVVLSTRGGDFELHLGQDISIGYLSHTESTVRLYLQETFTFLQLTAEAAVVLAAGSK
jgi:putative iron-dependent peroxidase